jgi:ATP-binding cassette subfamily B protein RaxB
MGIERYRKLVGTVMQDDQLFAGSIGDNISFFDPGARPEAIERVARLAAVHEEIGAMPMGYNTLIGEMGSALSGGQQQRLLLARALYQRPSILILDEATSHLDVPTEQRIAAMLAELRMTRVFAAHRPDTIRIANRVIALSRSGRISEELSPQAAAHADERIYGGETYVQPN